MTGGRRPVDPDRVRELTRAGWSARRIADELGCVPDTVHRIRVRLGIAQPRPPRYTDEEWKTVERLLDEGASLTEAARSIGRSEFHVQHVFRGRGWTPRQAVEYRHLLRRMDGLS